MGNTDTRTPQEKANLRLVLTMFDQVLNAMDADAADRFIAPDYIQHHQSTGPGVAPLKALLRQIKQETPQAVHDVKRAFVDGDHVIVHYHVRRWPDDLGWAVIDIFRIENGLIAEHWDVLQTIGEDSPNPNSPF